MKIKLYILSFILLIIWLFCTSPLKPDFEPPVIGNGKQIQTPGDPIINSLYYMYITATGTDTLKYQWYKNDTAIINAVIDTLKFDTLEYSDSGYYYCIVTNDFGADTSLTYKLLFIDLNDIIKPTIILITPQDSSIVSDSLVQVTLKIFDDTSQISLVTIQGDTVTSSDSIYTDTVILNSGINTIPVIAEDGSGNRDTLKITLTYDNTKPTIVLISPSDSTIVPDSIALITLKIFDDISQISLVTIQGDTVASSDSIYTDNVTLAQGINTIPVIALDSCRNSDTLNVTLTYDSTFVDSTGPDITKISPTGNFIKDSIVTLMVNVFDVSGISTVIIEGEIVTSTDDNYSKQLILIQGQNTITVVAKDASINSNIDTAYIELIYDPILPTLSLLNPGLDSSVTGSSSKKVEVIAKDNYGIQEIKFIVGTYQYEATAVNDTIYFANITDLTANVFTIVKVVATDSADNKDSLLIAIKYDPTMVDDEPPVMVYQSGPLHNERVKTATGTICYNITDANGVDTAYYTLNGAFAGALTPLGSDLYECSYNLGIKYGINSIKLFATDNSSNHNKDSVLINLNFNTALTSVTNVAPAEGENEVAVLSTFDWSGGRDVDGDTVTYKVWHGTESNVLSNSINAGLDTTVQAGSALPGNTQIYWKATAYSQTYPEDSVSSDVTSFVTYNIPPIVSLSSPSSGATKISVKPTLIFGATLGDDDAVSYTVWLGKTKPLNSSNQIATNLTTGQFTLATSLDMGIKYYWLVIATEIEGAGRKSDTSKVDSFYTENEITWNSQSFQYYNYRNHTIKISLSELVTYNTNPGHSLEILLQSIGGGSATILNDTLIWRRPWSYTADTTIAVIAKDLWVYDTASDTASFIISQKTQPAGTAGMRFIPARNDTFDMGQEGLSGGGYAEPVHKVTFTYNFWMDTTEVTQVKFDDLMKVAYVSYYITPQWDVSTGIGDRYPAYYINFYEILLFCNALSKQNGLDTVYKYSSIINDPSTNDTYFDSLGGLSVDYSKNGFRLPTEAEWEYACRAGTKTDFYWGNVINGDYAWYWDNSNNSTQIVAQKLPNNFGLFDIAGNVREWCNDDWEYGYTSADLQIDPIGPNNNTLLHGPHPERGGDSQGGYLLSAYRGDNYNPANGKWASNLGFRVVIKSQE